MFWNKCSRCDSKIKKDFEFCPNCGNNLKSKFDREDYGYLGKNDFVEDTLSSNFNDSFMDKMLNSAMKLLEKQMRSFQDEVSKNPKPSRDNFPPNNLNIQFFVNGKKVFPEKRNQMQSKNFISSNQQLFNEKLKKFSNLPKKEPSSKLRRLSGKLIYELLVPGVNSIEDVLINKLENSIEIRALSNNKIYSKNLNLNLPIISYDLTKGLLTLELQDSNN